MKKTVESRAMRLPVAAALALACGALRGWQLAGAFEGELSLPIPMAPASIALTALLVAAAAAMVLLVRHEPRKLPQLPLLIRGDRTGMMLLVAAAFLSLAAVPGLLLQGRDMWLMAQADPYGRGNNGVMLMVAAATAALAFAGLLVAARCAFRGEERGRSVMLLPAVNGCVWLMEVYRDHAADPVLWDYAPLLLAVVCGMLFYMDCAGLSAGAARPRRVRWLAGMTVILSATALVGCREVGSLLLLFSQLCAALTVLWRLPHDGNDIPERTEQALSVEEKLEEETHE